MRRAVLIFGVVVLTLLGLLAGVYAFATQTAWGRERVRALVLPQLAPLFAGSLSVGEIADVSLGLDRIVLVDVEARDPTGAVVLKVRRLSVRIAPLPLLDLQVRIADAQIEAPFVDLSDLGEERGLVAAFLPPPSDEPAAPEPDTPSPPVGVRIDRFAIHAGVFSADVPELGQLGASGIEASGRFELAEAVTVEVERLRSSVLRKGEEVGAIEALSGRVVTEGAASHVRLRARLADSPIQVHGEARLPSDPDFAASELKLHAEVGHVDGALLALVDQGEALRGLAGPVDVEADLSGTGGAPRAAFVLRARGGRIDGQASLSEQGHAEVTLSGRDLALSELHSDLPTARVSAQLRATAELEDADEGVPVSLGLEQARWNGTRLPELKAQARLSEDAARGLTLDASGYGGHLRARGQVDFDGRARATVDLSLPSLARLPRALRGELDPDCDGHLSLHARLTLRERQLSAKGTLETRNLRLRDLEASALDASFDASGEATAPRIDAEVSGRGLRAGEARLRRLYVNVAGGPKQYALRLLADLPDGRVQAQLSLARERDALQVSASARGQMHKEQFSLTLPNARIGFDGSLGVQGLRVSALGQELAASGRYDKRGVEGLTVQVEGIDLALLSQALSLSPALVGKADLRATAHGHIDAPSVTLHLEGRGLGIPDKPLGDLTLDASLDAPAGRAALRTNIVGYAAGQAAARRSESVLSLQLAADAEFPEGRHPSWQARVDGARFDANLDLKHLESAFIDGFVPEPLPAKGALVGHLQARGSIREPALDGELRLQVRELTPGRDVELATRFDYADGSGHARIQLDDRDGTWLSGQLGLTHPERSTEAIVRDAEHLLQLAQYDAELSLSARPVAYLPGAPSDAAQARVTLDGHVALAHLPEREPEVNLFLHMHNPAGSEDAAACVGHAAELELQAKLADGRLQSEVSLRRLSEQLLALDLSAALVLAPLLAGTGSPDMHAVTADAQLAEVELASLPYLCQLVHGRISGRARAQALLSPSPSADVDLRIAGLSLDGNRHMNASIKGALKLPRGELSLELGHGDKRSSVRASLPVELVERVPRLSDRGPLSVHARLDELPIGVFVPPKQAISRVSGTLSGRLDIVRRRDRRLALTGYLEPHKVGFTATSIAQPLSDIDGRIRIGEDVVEIERLVAHDGEGKLQLTGRLQQRSLSDYDAQLSITADEFPLRQEGRVAGLVDAEVGVRSQVRAESVSVNIALGTVSVWLRGGDLRQGIDLDPHPDIIDPRAQPIEDAAGANTAPDAESVKVTLGLTSKETFWVRRDDFAVRLAMDLDARIEAGQVLIEGPVRLRRGYLQLLGKTFDLDSKSTITFVASQPPNPVLDIRATAENRKTAKRIGVNIRGRASAPEIEFVSDDKVVSAGEAAEALFGGGGGTASAGVAGQAQSFVSGILSGVMAVSARRELGELMPMLMVEPGDSESGARVRAGFELDSLVPGFLQGVIRGVYVEGIIAASKEEEEQGDGSKNKQSTQGGVLIELYLPHDLVTSGQYGPGQTWSVDLGWQP